MNITRITVTPKARAHMRGKHGVSWREVEEVMEQDLPLRRGRDVNGERRYYVKGTTADGRRLRVILALAARGEARIITAFDE
jgi:uncharacterized DUF497 family protein